MTDKDSLAFNYLVLAKSVDTHSTTQEYRSGQTIFDQGDKADAIFYIRNGNAKLTVVSKSGKKAVIAILRCGDFFGEKLLDEAKRCGRLAQQRFEPPPSPGWKGRRSSASFNKIRHLRNSSLRIFYFASEESKRTW